jgi:ABC-type transport system involved in cytochrome c biogenesis permease subunit
MFLLIFSFMQLKGLFRSLLFMPVACSFCATLLLILISLPSIMRDPLPPFPALRSLWLVVHVGFAITGEVCFGFGCILSVFILFMRKKENIKEADNTACGIITAGYISYTIGGLIIGAIWAEEAWGSFWSWDTKETWAFIALLVYTIYLHLRLVSKDKPKLLASVSITGYLCSMFTFIGVNFLFKGLHSY